MTERPTPGFTLLEVLVVVVIAGVVATFAVLSIDRGAARALTRGGELVAAALDLAGDAAVLSGRPHALLLARDGFMLLRFRDAGWEPAAGSAWRQRLPAGVNFVRAACNDLARCTPTTRPQVVVLPDGTPYGELPALEQSGIGDGARRLRVVPGRAGRFALEALP